MAIDETHLSIHSERAGGEQHVSLDGELDIARAPELGAALDRVEATAVRDIELDLSGLRFIDCAGLRTIVAASARSRARGKRLRVTSIPERVRRILALTGSDEQLLLV
jgi:anti-sigma B factor antagonist